MTPLERAASAIAGHFGPEFHELPDDKRDQRELARDGLPYENNKEDMLEAARAAIEALMEPSEGMIEASTFVPQLRVESLGIWQAMLTAALEEKP